MSIQKRISELNLRLERCKDVRMEIECNIERLDTIMAGYIRELKQLEIALKDEALKEES